MKNLVTELMEHHKIMDNIGALTHYGVITGINTIPDSFDIETTIRGGLNLGGYIEEVLNKEFIGKYTYGNRINSIEVTVDEDKQFLKYIIKTDKVDYTPSYGISLSPELSIDDIINQIIIRYKIYEVASKKKFLCYIGELVGFSSDLEFSEVIVIHSVNTPEEAELKYLELMSKTYPDDTDIVVGNMFVRTINISGISMNNIKKIIREVADTNQRHIFDITIPNEIKLMDKIIDNLQGR